MWNVPCIMCLGFNENDRSCHFEIANILSKSLGYPCAIREDVRHAVNQGLKQSNLFLLILLL